MDIGAMELALLVSVAVNLVPMAAAQGAIKTRETASTHSHSLLMEEEQIAQEVEAVDRQKMVHPAPKGFRPEQVGRKVRLRLVARDKKIRPGKSFWYRLELQNVGSEAVRFWDSPSFLKSGVRYDSGKWRFFVVSPDGKSERMIIGRLADEMTMDERPNPPIPVKGAEQMTDAEVRDFVWRDGVRRRADVDLRVTLAPGETLVSRPWRWVTVDEAKERHRKGETDLWPKPEGTFRELWTLYQFKEPGRYAIHAEYDDPALPPPSEDFLKKMEGRGHKRAAVMEDYRKSSSKSLGRVESSVVELEVAP